MIATPDGISGEEWDLVREIAVDIVNASDGETENRSRHRLFEYLDRLEAKYGPLPSILATKADFLEDVTTKEQLLVRAYTSAENTDDARNALYIAHSLADLFIGDSKDVAKGRHWLECMKKYLVRVDDSWFAEEYERLRGLSEACN